MKKIFVAVAVFTISVSMYVPTVVAYDLGDFFFTIREEIELPCGGEQYENGICSDADDTYYDSETETEVPCTEDDYDNGNCSRADTHYFDVRTVASISHGDVTYIPFGRVFSMFFVDSNTDDPPVYGELYYLPDGQGGTREFIDTAVGYGELSFEHEGVYEIDVYESIIEASYVPTWKDALVQFILPRAYAAHREPIFFGTMRFEIRDIENMPEGNPSVLFLPGTQASRLYDGDDGNRLWEPSGNTDVGKLALDASGNSIENVQTKDVIDEIDVIPLLQSNIYKGFMSYLDDLVDADVIEDWEPYAYDWRRSVFDVVENGSTYYDGTSEGEQKYLVDLVEELAAQSQNGKVAIIGHSNGGLLAKTLMMKLEEEGKDDLIDSVVFVATPHLGTPKAIATVLHGHDQEKVGGLLVDDEVAREVIKNMPGAYALLPSEKYMEVATGPLVTFRDSSVTQSLINFYGTTVSGIAEFVDFMNGAEGRTASGMPINEPSVANTSLLLDALEDHTQKLDTWTAPEHVQVYEIVGTGLATIKSLEYREMTERVCEYSGNVSNPLSCTNQQILKPYALQTLYGDETVMSVSAEGYSEDKEKFYLNLQQFDFSNTTAVELGHSNITEIDSVHELIGRILEDGPAEDIDFISNDPPQFDDNYRVISVHSPVKIEVTDTDGNVTGVDSNNAPKEEIPGSSYFEIGGSKYVVVPADIDYDVVLKGEGNGGYTLIIDALENGDEQENLHTAENMLVSTTTIATFSKEGESFSSIIVDENGDGEPDAEFTVDGEEIVAAEPTPQELLQEYRDAVDGMNVSATIKRNFKASASLAEDLINRNRIYLAKLTIEAMKGAIKLRENLRQISKVDAKILLDILVRVEQSL